MKTTPTKADRIRDRLILHEIETYLCATAFGKVATQGALKAAAKKLFRSGSLPKPVAARLGLVDAVSCLAQERYFNANRGKMERQGVDVDEWNQASKGADLPRRAGVRHLQKGFAPCTTEGNCGL